MPAPSSTRSTCVSPTNRTHCSYRAGLGQLSIVEHALCPLDPNISLQTGAAFDADYFFTDKHRHQRQAHATVLCPLGLSANDEFYLWGLLALTFAQRTPEPEFWATPHYCLRHLGVIDHRSRRGGRQYEQFAQAIERLSAVTYRNDRFYDPVRAEHRKVSFGFLSYSLPLDVESNRAWRFAWDPLFFEFVAAISGHFRFDLTTYRNLDAASRRLFLFASKIFSRRETTPRLNLRHLGENIIGFSSRLQTKHLKAKVAQSVTRLAERGIVASANDLFRKHGRGHYSVTLYRGPYFTRRKMATKPLKLEDSPLFETLLAVGFDDATAARLLVQYPGPIMREWADITLAAHERFGPGFFTKSPQAYFVDNIQKVLAGQRTPPDWWLDIRRAERQKGQTIKRDWAAALTAASNRSAPPSKPDKRTPHSFEQIRDELHRQFVADGRSEPEARQLAERMARRHLEQSIQGRTVREPIRLDSLLRSLPSKAN